MRYLVDASTLIALASCDRLELLRQLTGEVWTTSRVVKEVLSGAEGRGLDEEWIHVIDADGMIPRLGPGESSLILAATADDVLVLDDRTARLEAQRRSLGVTGLLGLLVHGHRRGVLDTHDAVSLLQDLADGDFRMTVELYRWALDHIKG